MDVPELLRRATDLIPHDAKSDADLCADDIRDYLGHDEWEVALGAPVTGIEMSQGVRSCTYVKVDRKARPA